MMKVPSSWNQEKRDYAAMVNYGLKKMMRMVSVY